MQPNVPQSYPSMEYLNQIAPQAPKRGRFSKFQLMIFGGAAFVLILIIASIIAATTSGGDQSSQQLAARLLSTQTIVASAQKTIKSTQLSALNSNLLIYLTGTNHDIVAPLKALGIDVAHLDPIIVKNEAGTDVTARLEDARLNAVYDSTYAREMSYRLDTIVNLMQKIENSTSSSKMKAFLETAKTNLAPTQKAFSEFNDATNT